MFNLKISNLLIYLGLLASASGCVVWDLKPKAAIEFNCPKAQVSVDEPLQSLFYARGCGRENFYTFLGNGEFASLLKRASFDLNCPSEALKLNHVGGGSVGVTGCGKKAVYVDLGHKGWVLNSDERPAK